jgi:hypothetical protein
LKPSNLQWWILVIVALLVVFVWPPSGDKSLAAKFVNWAVDSQNALPVLPDRLALGMGDDTDAVQRERPAHAAVRRAVPQGGWTRKRLELKVAGDPLSPSTERQPLTGIAALTAFLVWRSGGRTN